jgi:hypothetical protein
MKLTLRSSFTARLIPGVGLRKRRKDSDSTCERPS